MKVYRIQNAKGSGPFCPGVTQKWIDEYIQDKWPDAPIAEQIKALQEKKDNEYLCFACESIEDLRFWFSEGEYKKLKKLGYFAYYLEANIVRRFDYQSIVSTKRRLDKISIPFQLY